MIQDLSVAGEKYSSVRYLATLDFTFNEDEVRSLLSRKGVPYAVTQAKTIVVLPLLRADGTLVLWEEPNPWFGAWRSLPGGQLVPVMVPLGDLTDVEIIGAEDAAVGEPQKVAEITTRYQASEALVPFAVLDTDTASGAAEVAVALTLYGPEGARKGPTRRYSAAEGESVDQLLSRAAEATMTEVQNQWKRENLVRAGEAADRVGGGADHRPERLADGAPAPGAGADHRKNRRRSAVALARRDQHPPLRHPRAARPGAGAGGPDPSPGRRGAGADAAGAAVVGGGGDCR